MAAPSLNMRTLALLLLFLVAGLVLLVTSGGLEFGDPVQPPSGEGPAAPKAAAADEPEAGAVSRVDAGGPDGGSREGRGSCRVEGQVFTLREGNPVAGTEVLALRRFPATGGLEGLFRNLFRNGLWRATPRPERPQVLARARTDDRGAFVIEGVPEGRVWLALGEGYHYAYRYPRLQLRPGEHKKDVRIAAAQGGLVRGRVVDQAGRPVAGALLDLRPGFNSFLSHFFGKGYRWRMARTDAEGRYTLSGVPVGREYVLSAFGPGLPLMLETDIEVEPLQERVVDLQGLRGAEIAGRVENLEGEPLAGARVAIALMDLHLILFSAEACPPVIAGADGSFRIGNLPPGELAVAAVHAGEAVSERENLFLKEGDRVGDLVLKVGGGQTLAGLVVDHEGRPVEGAAVESLSGERPRSFDMGLFLSMRRSRASSDAQGRFTLAGLKGNRVFLRVKHPDHAERLLPRVKVGRKDLRIELQPKAVVTGIVLDKSTSRPLQRFTVVRRGGFNMGREPQRWEFKVEQGKFRIEDAPAGRTRLAFSAAGFITVTRRLEIDPVKGAKGVIVMLEPEATISGQVVGAGGTPVPGASIMALRRGQLDGLSMSMRPRNRQERREFGRQMSLRFGGGMGPGGPGRGGSPMAGMLGSGGPGRTLSDRFGRFKVTGLAPGRWQLFARHPDHARNESVTVETSAAEPATGVTIKMTRGGTIHGTVTGLDGQPVVHAVVVAATMKGAIRSEATDAKGYYRLEHLLPGSYFVFKSRIAGRTTRNLAADLLGNMRLKTVSVKEEEVVRFDINDRVEDGIDVTGVVRKGGKPMAECMVTALTSQGDGPLGIGVRSTVSDKDGRYLLPSLRPGSYIFQVAAHRSRPSTVQVEVPAGATRLRRDIDLPISTIEGLVTDMAGKPVPGCRVRAVPGKTLAGGGLLNMMISRSAWRGSTDKEGRFVLKQVPRGRYRLEVEAPRRRKDLGAASLAEVEVDGTAPLQGLRVQLPAAAVLAGMVRDGRELPVVGATVRAVRLDSGEKLPEGLQGLKGLRAPRARTDREGRFELKGLAPGRWKVSVEKEGYAPAGDLETALLQGEEKNLDLAMVKGGTVRVRVVNNTGGLIPAENIRVLDSQGRRVTRVVSAGEVFRRMFGGGKKEDKDGWTTLKDIRPGQYTVVVRGRDGKDRQRRPVTVKEGETTEFELVLEGK